MELLRNSSSPNNVSLAGPALDEYDVEEYSLVFEFIIVGLGITSVSVLGIFGNLLSACVLARSQMKSSVTCLLLGLTFADTLLILTSSLIFGLPVLFTYLEAVDGNGFMNVFYPACGPYLYALAVTAQTASVYFTVAVTVERYVVVCRPLQARSLCTLARARQYSVAVFLFSALYNLPRWWELKAEPVYRSPNVVHTYQLGFTDFRMNPIYVEYYVNWAYLGVMCLVPFMILLTLNVAIHMKIIKANRERNDLTSRHLQDSSFSVMLLCVVTTFLVCNVLALIVNLLECMWKIVLIDLENLSNFLITLNSSVNCAIYCIVGHKFRKQLFLMRDETLSKASRLLQRLQIRKITKVQVRDTIVRSTTAVHRITLTDVSEAV